MESFGDQLFASFCGSLFDWSRAWGLTSSDSFLSFLSSHSFVINFLFVFLYFYFPLFVIFGLPYALFA